MSYGPKVCRIKGVNTILWKGRRFVVSSDYEHGDIFDLKNNPLPAVDPQMRDTSRMMLFQFQLMSEKAVNTVAYYVSSLIPRRYFGFIFVSLMLLQLPLIAMLGGGDAAVASYDELLSKPNIIWLILGLLSILFLHEIGHASSAINSGILVDSLGFGLYIIFPAFYTKMSMMNFLEASDRKVIIASGVYVQLVISIALGVTYLMTGWAVALSLFTLNMVTVLFNLVPIARLDGYRFMLEFIPPDDFEQGRKTRSRVIRFMDLLTIIIVLGLLTFYIVRFWDYIVASSFVLKVVVVLVVALILKIMLRSLLTIVRG